MQGLAESILAIIEPVVTDIGSPAHQRNLASAFDAYHSAVETSLSRYKDHLGKKNIDVATLRQRYILETAVLHTLTHILTTKMCSMSVPPFLWPIHEEQGFFNWYQLPARVQADINESLVDIVARKDLELTLSYTLDRAFRTIGLDYLGEYYTPLPIARHLLHLSELKPVHILRSHKVVDPSCGGGVLLLLAAQEVIAELGAHAHDQQTALNLLSTAIYGYDIQPFAVALTRSLLVSSCAPLLQAGATFPGKPFSQVRLQDPLATPREFWNPSQFEWILGNPPFQPIKKAGIDYVDAYADALYGHPNLYQLFLWWAVLAARPDGRIAFLLPQSLLAGSFFHRLRQQLSERAQLLGVTRLIERKGIVGDADQQMMAIALKINSLDTAERSRDVAIRVTWNGDDIEQAPIYSVSSDRVVQTKNEQIIWIVSESSEDYAILEILEQAGKPLAQMKHIFLLNNGEYVWNQHKHLLSQENGPNSYPLLSAACVKRYTVTFPYAGPHSTRKRSFSRLDPAVLSSLHSGPTILVQRTTPRKVGRRLFAGILDNKFLSNYGRYFVENHVNYIKPALEKDADRLYGLLAWLNSDLMNFVFQLENGTPHVSISDLGLLPTPNEALTILVEPAKTICSSDKDEQKLKIAEINNVLFDHFHLSSSQRKRVRFVLDRAERKPN